MLTLSLFLRIFGLCSLTLGILSCLYILFDQRRRPAPHMAIMKWVWPINALWAGLVGIWAYRTLGNGKLALKKATDSTVKQPPAQNQGGAMSGMTMPDMNMPNMATLGIATPMHNMSMPGMSKSTPMSMPMQGMPTRTFPESVAVGTLHCGAGCTLADLVGPCVFRYAPFVLWGSPVFGEWAFDYVLALAFGVIFQYAGLAAMTNKRGVRLWWQAFRVDFLSLTAWQIGMYGWMAIATFGLPLALDGVLFWFMMQVAMFCGFMTAYPMNWWLIRCGVKTAM